VFKMEAIAAGVLWRMAILAALPRSLLHLRAQ
jgi:hypothetical protein